MSVRPFKGKHPAEKPQFMLLHIVEASECVSDNVAYIKCEFVEDEEAAV